MNATRCRFQESASRRLTLCRNPRLASSVIIRFRREASSQSPSNGFSSLYIDSTPPSEAQRLAAIAFFNEHRPLKTWVANEWRAQPDSNLLTPEVVFLGRSNVGKSSLLNAIFGGETFCRVGSKPGKTKEMHAWDLVQVPSKVRTKSAKEKDKDYSPKLTLLDMPGYGYGSTAEWGANIMKYLTQRKQLKRAFVLINPAHGLMSTDLQMLELLQRHGISHQLVACKCDELSPRLVHIKLEEIRNALTDSKRVVKLQVLRDILAVGFLGDGDKNNRVRRHLIQGLDEVEWAVLRATGLDEFALGTQPAGLDSVSRPTTAPLSISPPQRAAVINVDALLAALTPLTSAPASALSNQPQLRPLQITHEEKVIVSAVASQKQKVLPGIDAFLGSSNRRSLQTPKVSAAPAVMSAADKSMNEKTTNAHQPQVTTGLDALMSVLGEGSRKRRPTPSSTGRRTRRQREP